METPRFYALCKTLVNHASSTECVLIGSAPLALRGLRDVNDLDVLLTEKGLDAIVALASAPLGTRGWGLDGANRGKATLATLNTPDGVIQASSNLIDHTASCGLTEAEVFRDAGTSTATGYRVMSLEHMERFKRHRGMEKDVDDLQLVACWRASGAGAHGVDLRLDPDVVPGRFSGPARFGIPGAPPLTSKAVALPSMPTQDDCDRMLHERRVKKDDSEPDPHIHNAAIMLGGSYANTKTLVHDGPEREHYSRYGRALAKTILLPLEMGFTTPQIVDLIKETRDTRTGALVFPGAANVNMTRAIDRLRARQDELLLPRSFPVRPNPDGDGWVLVDDHDPDEEKTPHVIDTFPSRDMALGAMRVLWRQKRNKNG